MTQNLVIRFPFPLRRVDEDAIDQLQREFQETAAAARIGPEGEPQVRTSSGEVYNLTALPKFQARRLARTITLQPLPPAGAMALRAA
jgi:hypothetical protein